MGYVKMIIAWTLVVEIKFPLATGGCISLVFMGFYNQIHWISNEVGIIRQFIIWRYLAVIILVLAGFLR
jgi:hypothetical protein